MKLPSHILQAPPEYLDENMIAAFRQIGYGCLPLWTNHGCALFVHIDTRSIKECRYAVHNVRLELHEVDGSPLIRLDMKVYDRPGDPLHMDCFLHINRQDGGHIPAIEALTEQEWIIFHWYDEKLKYIRSSGVRWPLEQREDAKKIIKEAQATITRTGGGDFDRAKAKFMQNNPI